MFNADDLMENAYRDTGLTQYGSAPLREGLDVYCRSLNNEAKLNEAGVASVLSEIRTTLAQRLLIEEYYRNFPETDQQQVVAPIMVTGLPRGGTTALSQMLSKDPALRSIRRWEAQWPYPPSQPDAIASDPRVEEMRAILDRQLAATPEFRTMLQIAANDPTEHYCFLRLTFQSMHLAGFHNTPSYGEWFLSCDMAPAYTYMRRVLKMLQVNHPDKRWNLKHPHDLLALDAVAAAFPDVHFIWNHRDPVRTIPSACSLIVTLRRTTTDQIDKAAIGEVEFERCDAMLSRGMAYRSSAGSKPFVDVYNRDLIKDAAGTIRDLYGKLGLEFTAAFNASLNARNQALPKGKYGAHDYSLEEFGLNQEIVVRRFAPYRASIGLDPAISGQ